MRRIGVFVCHCGTNIASTVDVKTVAETLGKEPSVVFATDYPYMCSEAGQNIIKMQLRNISWKALWYVHVLQECMKQPSGRQSLLLV